MGGVGGYGGCMLWVALFVAVVSGVASLWVRSGSPASRWYETEEGIVDERFAFAALPGLALAMLGAFVIGASLLTGTPWIHWGGVVLGVAILQAGVVLGFHAFGRGPLPPWILPRWKR